MHFFVSLGFKATSMYVECVRESNITMYISGENGTNNCSFETFIAEVL
jgi:hypothetical protein